MATNSMYSASPFRGEVGAGLGTRQSAGGPAAWGAQLFVAALATAVSGAILVYIAQVPSGLARFNDFYREAWPAYAALGHGHLLGFLRLAPPYAGSLVARAPFTLIPRIWGGASRATYVASAAPCMIAAAAFCTWLAAQPRRRGGIGWASRVFPIFLCVLNPIVLIGLFGGHPEEVLGAVLCVTAVVLASKGKMGWAAALTAVAVVNKPWALVAVPVVVVALPPDRRRTALVMIGATGAVLLPLVAVRSGGFSAVAIGTAIGRTFNAPQLLWWLGPHSWIAQEARIAIVGVAFVCAALWWAWQSRTSRQPTQEQELLLLLTAVLLLRAALDPWNNAYYHVPFLFALLAYETRSGLMPVLTVLYSLVLLIVVPIRGIPPMSSDLRAAIYAVVVLTTVGWIVGKLYAFRVDDAVSRVWPVRIFRAARAAPAEPT
jgi:hypothetical protein